MYVAAYLEMLVIIREGDEQSYRDWSMYADDIALFDE